MRPEDRFNHITELFHPTLEDWEEIFATLEEYRKNRDDILSLPLVREIPKSDNDFPW